MCRLTIHNPSHEPPQRTPPSGFVVSCLVVQHSPKSERRGPYPFGFGRPCDGNRAGWRRSEFPAMKKSGQVLVRTMSSQSDELPKGSRGMSGVLNLVLGLIITLTFSCGLGRFPALVRRGCPRAARAGAVCSKPKVPINKERYAIIYKDASRL